MFFDLCVNLGSHFGDMEYVMFWRPCKSFIYLMILHLGPIPRKLCVTEHDQTAHRSSFITAREIYHYDVGKCNVHRGGLRISGKV